MLHGKAISKSYAKGPSEPAIPEGTIGEWLDLAVERFGARPALVAPWQGVRWTWADLRDQTDALARGLAGLGLTAGDRVRAARKTLVVKWKCFQRKQL